MKRLQSLKALKETESDIQRKICVYLKLGDVFHWRQNNTGKMPGGRYVSVKKGVPDIMAIKDGRFIGIEVKKKDGRLSPEQVEFGRMCVKNGGEYIVARSIDDVEAAGL
jgi:VRR-NUC domain